jgi:hypothetical protein
MSLESGTFISDLVATNPTSADPKSQGDDHLRLLKSTIKNSFPTINAALTAALVPFVPTLEIPEDDVQAAIAYAGTIGGGGAIDGIFYENDQIVTKNYTITTNKNAMSAGKITIADGIIVTVPPGSTWSIV